MQNVSGTMGGMRSAVRLVRFNAGEASEKTGAVHEFSGTAMVGVPVKQGVGQYGARTVSANGADEGENDPLFVIWQAISQPKVLAHGQAELFCRGSGLLIAEVG